MNEDCPNRARQRWLGLLALASLVAAAGCEGGDGPGTPGDNPPDSTTPVAVAAAFPARGYVPLAVALDASASHDPDGTLVSHSWDLDGDGTGDAGDAAVDHVFTEAGTYLATVTVTDDEGGTADAVVQIEVLPDVVETLFAEPFDSDPFGADRWAVYLGDCVTDRPGTVEYETAADGCGGYGGYITRGGTSRCVIAQQPAFTTEGFHQLQLDYWVSTGDGSVGVDVILDGAWTTVGENAGAGSWSPVTVTGSGTMTGIRTRLESDGALDCVELTGVRTCRPAEERACEGGHAIFSVSAVEGSGLSYQWRRGEEELVDGDRIEGATSAMLVLREVTADDQGGYACSITGTGGSWLSSTGQLVIEAEPSIAGEPQGTEVTAGEAATLSVDATGVGTITYQWYRDGATLADGQGIAGSTDASLTLTAATTADAGLYHCEITDDCGGPVATAQVPLVVRTWDGEATLVPGGSVHVDLDYQSDWIIEAELFGCAAHERFDRYLQQETRLDLFNRGDGNLALRLANTQICCESANLGGVSTEIGSTDHFGETVPANIVNGDHSLRIEYLGSQSQARLYWDGALIGDWNLWIESTPGAMGQVEVSHMDGGTIRWYQGGFTSLVDL